MVDDEAVRDGTLVSLVVDAVGAGLLTAADGRLAVTGRRVNETEPVPAAVLSYLVIVGSLPAVVPRQIPKRVALCYPELWGVPSCGTCLSTASAMAIANFHVEPPNGGRANRSPPCL